MKSSIQWAAGALLCVSVICAPSLYTDGATNPPPLYADFLTTHPILTIHLQVDDAALAGLRLQPRAYVRCAVDEGGQVYRDVGFHLKGQPGTFQNFDGKPSLTLNFDRFVQGQRFHGPTFARGLRRGRLDKLHLNNSVSDPTYLTEMVCRELFLAAGVPTGRAGHARVFLNGRDAGFYVVFEGYNKGFLKQHFGDASGHLYDSEFMHDINEPLKSSSSGGPVERGDLRELAEACQPLRIADFGVRIEGGQARS